jgi:hypothetical protein
VPLALLWTPAIGIEREEGMMAEEESLLVSPPTQDVAVHVRDYERFTKMMFRGAITALIIGLIVLVILKS